MIELRNIKKEYAVGEEKVCALKDVTLAFRKSEMVAVLGPSGCGKTTLLNIIGGLDVGTGDLVIDGRNAQYFRDTDWDAYRNNKIGFVFQSYNLIPHLSVLGNVELSLTLSGVSKAERRRRAAEALAKVGLAGCEKKKPNQLSGGEMQRVAIARAVINDPEIVLADEPTGALDSETSEQVLNILKEISEERLVIVVTHNRVLAEKYCTRIVTMLDGEITSDSSPVEIAPEDEGEKVVEAGEVKKKQRELTRENKRALGRTSMRLATAFALALGNLKIKLGRTIGSVIAGSIGIIGVALVLALSHGFSLYIGELQASMLSVFPVSVSQITLDTDATFDSLWGGVTSYHDGDRLTINNDNGIMEVRYNRITREYLDFVAAAPASSVADTVYDYSQKKLILSDADGSVRRVSAESDKLLGIRTGRLQLMLNNSDYVKSRYDLWGEYPTKYDEIAVVIGKDNSINRSVLAECGLKAPENIDDATVYDLIGQTLTLVTNDNRFTKDDKGIYRDLNTNEADEETLRRVFEAEGNVKLRVTAVMRIKPNVRFSMFSSGLVYTPALNDYLIADGKASEVGRAQAENTERCVSNAFVLDLGSTSLSTTGQSFKSIVTLLDRYAGNLGLNLTEDDLRLGALQAVGASDIPQSVEFYVESFGKKEELLRYLAKYNDDPVSQKMTYLDAAAFVTDAVNELIDVGTSVLVTFAAISLIVSAAMISILTYASVAERVKEIGVLRAVGARKLDIMRLFNAETALVGLGSGLFGVTLAYVLSFPVSAIFIGISHGIITTGIAVLTWWHVLALVAVSVALTLIAGMLPGMSAARRNVVAALRSE